MLDAVENCREVFVSRSADGIEEELEAFSEHHGLYLAYLAKKKAWEDSRLQVERNRKAHIAKEMAAYDLDLSLQAEQKEWAWSPLFSEFILVPLPPCLHRPFEHSEEEFQGLITWLQREGYAMGDRNSPPHMARALKLFAKSEFGARTPMLCHVRGLSDKTLRDRTQQVLFAMEELIRVGKIYFPTLDTGGEDFEKFREVLDCGDNIGDQVENFRAWRRNCFIRACCDSLRREESHILRDLWVKGEGVDREGCASVFTSVLLLRENIDLGYVFGSIEATGLWPRGGDAFFDAAKVLRRESVSACYTKLAYWNVKDGLEDLDDIRASQVLCTFDASRFSGETSGSPSRFSAEGGSPLRMGLLTDGQAEQETTSALGGGGWGQVEDGEPEAVSVSPVVVMPGQPV